MAGLIGREAGHWWRVRLNVWFKCFPGSLQHRTDKLGVGKAGFAGIEGDFWYFTQNTLSCPTSHCTFTSVSEKGFSQYLKAFKVLWQKSLLGMLGVAPPRTLLCALEAWLLRAAAGRSQEGLGAGFPCSQPACLTRVVWVSLGETARVGGCPGLHSAAEAMKS